MPIDPSIALNVKPIQLANPLEQYMQVQQIQGAQNQNRLANLMYGEREHETTQTARLNELYKGAVGADGNLDRTKLYSGVASAGLGSKLPGIQKGFTDLDAKSAEAAKTKAEKEKLDREAASHQFEIAGQLAAAWAQNPKITQATIRAGLASALHGKIISPEIYQAKLGELDAIPDNPTALNGWATGTLQQVMKAKDSFSYIAPDANTVANNKQSAANNAATNTTTRRGQNMIDSRAAEVNRNGRGQVVQTDQGVMLVDTRNGTAQPVTANGEALQPKLRQLPAAVQKGISENSASLRKVDTALAELEKYPDAFGLKNYLGDTIRQRTDPQGVTARAFTADIGSLIIHDRSGAAVTASETPRLKPFIPATTDDPDTIKKKLTRFRDEYKAIQEDYVSMYSREQGFRVPGGAAPAAGSKPTLGEIFGE